MVKISKSVIKTVTANKWKWLIHLNQKVSEIGKVVAYMPSWPISFPVDSRHLTQRTLKAERGNPVLLPFFYGAVHRKMCLQRCGIGRSEKANVVL